MRTGLINCTKSGTNPVRGAKLGQAIGLISWAASAGSTVSSLICDRWLTRKLVTFMGSTDSLECRTADSADMIDVRLRLQGWTYSEPARRGRGLALATWGWTCSEPLSRGLAGEHRGAGRTHVMLHSTSILLRPGTQSRPQVVQLVPISSSLHTSERQNLQVHTAYRDVS